LSAALAITNLLPLPALDGGRLLFILIEIVRGRRVSPEREGMIHMIGFALLLGLMLLITVNDLSSAPQTIDWSRLMGQ
jgi:regulator of sigma E protease